MGARIEIEGSEEKKIAEKYRRIDFGQDGVSIFTTTGGFWWGTAAGISVLERVMFSPSIDPRLVRLAPNVMSFSGDNSQVVYLEDRDGNNRDVLELGRHTITAINTP